MANYVQIGNQFAQFYFGNWNPQFDAEGNLLPLEGQPRTQLFNFYTPQTICTVHPDQEFLGGEQIMTYLCKYDAEENIYTMGIIKNVTSVTCQPSMNNTIAVLAQGELKMDIRQENNLLFSEFFIILPNMETGTIQILNQIFTVHG